MANPFGPLGNQLESFVNQAMDNPRGAIYSMIIPYDTKVHLFNLATISTIAFVAFAIFSGLTGGGSFVACLIWGLASLIGREILRIDLEDPQTLTGVVTAGVQGLNDLVGNAPSLFKTPILDLGTYCANIHYLCR